MKGGVGKTTVAANLAAHFSSTPKNKRVLLIDFDYQGSLSTAVLNQRGITDAEMTAHKLIIGADNAEMTALRAPPYQFRRQDAGAISLFSAHYAFATVENQLMADWLTQPNREVRFNLVKYLSSQAFLSRFDLVIVDCPPRITTATINALTSADFLLVPTVMDGLSAPGAEYFSRQIVRMRPNLFPDLKLLGIIPSITSVTTDLKSRESEVADDLERKVAAIWPPEARASDAPVVMKQSFIPRTGPIADAAGKGIAYFRNNQAKAIFARLGEEVQRRIDSGNRPRPAA
jgi:chromosome partitioning protein